MTDVRIILVTLGITLAYYVVGCCGLASIDKDGRVSAWYDAAPGPIYQMLVFLLWPVLVIAYHWPRRERNSG